MKFSDVVNSLEQGTRFRRASWPADSFIWYMPQADVKADWCREPVLHRLASATGTIHCGPAIRRFVDGMVITGWTPSAEDMFAQDWEVCGD